MEDSSAKGLRECVDVHVGNAGCRIGNKFWETLNTEHGVNKAGQFVGSKDSQIFGLPVFYQESYMGRYVPRAIMTDLENDSLDFLQSSDIYSLYNPAAFVYGQDVGAGNNFAKGFYSVGQHVIEDLLDITRQECEKCSHLQGFQVTHSIAGGTGSGFTALFLTQLRDALPNVLVSTFSIFPSNLGSDIVEENYNAVLAIDRLMELVDHTLMFDNNQMSSICQSTHPSMGPQKCTWDDLNQLVSTIISGASAAYRFWGGKNADALTFSHNLVPFPRLKFFVSSFAPILGRTSINDQVTTLQDLLSSVFIPQNCLCYSKDFKEAKPKILASSVIFRGDISGCFCEKVVADYQVDHPDEFLEWMPNSIHVAQCDIPNSGYMFTAQSISNSTIVEHTFMQLTQQFKAMYDHQAFLHWYVQEGCEVENFAHSYETVISVIQEYHRFKTGESIGSPEAEAVPVAEETA